MALEEDVIALVAKKSEQKIRDISLDSNFDELGDSIDRVEILLEVEKKYGVEDLVTATEESNIHTIGELINTVKKYNPRAEKPKYQQREERQEAYA